MEIVIDPRCDIRYCSYYIYALMQFSRQKGAKIRWSRKEFSQLPDSGGLRFVVDTGDSRKKYVVHTGDSFELQMANYEWCDVYGSVNANYGRYPLDKYPKLMPIVPSFAIRCYGNARLVIHTISVFAMTYKDIMARKEWSWIENRAIESPKLNIKKFFTRSIKNNLNRVPIDCYENHETVRDNYVFSLNTLWASDDYNQNDMNCNLRRAHFIRACKSIPQVKFEGGMVGNRDVFQDCLLPKGVTMKEWLMKTKQSMVVFNTPAFLNCHGWKLGEYLAMGKAIISTELFNELPVPLEHGKNVYFVEDNEDAMREAVQYIAAHPEYRKQLEYGARTYWEKYGSPMASLKMLGVE